MGKEAPCFHILMQLTSNIKGVCYMELGTKCVAIQNIYTMLNEVLKAIGRVYSISLKAREFRFV